jgi:hypothetical protein
MNNHNLYIIKIEEKRFDFVPSVVLIKFKQKKKLLN